mmetsp:Transcript_28768/g.79256  ORF Transcript_28768/g.79256 Transcript_28768/m.79256 type:complete len:427 (+) Transcript_28768:65-1345(+)
MVRETAEARASPIGVAAVLVLVSVSLVPFLCTFDWLQEVAQSPVGVALVDAAALALVAGMGVRSLRWCGWNPSLFNVFFMVTMCSAMLHLIFAASLLGLTHVGRFYMQSGEQYFKTSWGISTLLWDGTIHYTLQWYIAWRTLLGRPCTGAGLFWSGSMMNSMLVLFLGAFTGDFASSIKPSTALNAPYFLLAFWILGRLLADPRFSTSRKPSEGAQHFVDYMLLLYHATAVLLHIVRAIAVLGSESPVAILWIDGIEPELLRQGGNKSSSFILAQVLLYFFYYIPFHVLAAWRPFTGNHQGPLAAWATVVAGGYAHGQATYIGAAVLRWRDYGDIDVSSHQPLFWVANLAIAMVPVIVAARFWRLSSEGGPGSNSSRSCTAQQDSNVVERQALADREFVMASNVMNNVTDASLTDSAVHGGKPKVS